MSRDIYEENIARLPKALQPLAQFMVTPLVDPRKQKESILANPFAFFTFLTKKKVQPKVFMSFKNFNDISIEFLAMICKHLEPNDIFMLSGVCKNLRTLLLDLESPATQEIWRNSRLEYCPFLQLSPPKGMQEQEYISLCSTERGCQFCGQRKQWVKVYWQFRVRACYECYLPRFVRNSHSKHTKNFQNTYDKEEIKLREHYDRRRLEHTISFRKERLQEIIEELEAERKESSDDESIHSNSSNSSSKYDAQLLRKCPIISAEWKKFDQPFTNRDQLRFRRKLDYEYQILAKHYVS
ncbi:17340_t:CDS:2 [Dentiscutata heterogama]|uniref:17340_t:CDS:1 n=1 Tax=Dentiscutata heterogama TaxID=1316150 RepID=A0ACA9L744_9GLOM|nr:17340_t:CDS:2 [Dentiscutata heterogama]